MAAVKAILTAIFISILLSLVFGWLLMMSVGIAHHEWWPTIPTIGYFWSCVLAMTIRGTFSLMYVANGNDN